MASNKKKNKLKNSFGCAGTLKNKDYKCKRFLFYTSSQRKEDDRRTKDEVKNLNENNC